jgi:hypothetical protein
LVSGIIHRLLDRETDAPNGGKLCKFLVADDSWNADKGRRLKQGLKFGIKLMADGFEILLGRR